MKNDNSKFVLLDKLEEYYEGIKKININSTKEKLLKYSKNFRIKNYLVRKLLELPSVSFDQTSFSSSISEIDALIEKIKKDLNDFDDEEESLEQKIENIDLIDSAITDLNNQLDIAYANIFSGIDRWIKSRKSIFEKLKLGASILKLCSDYSSLIRLVKKDLLQYDEVESTIEAVFNYVEEKSKIFENMTMQERSIIKELDIIESQFSDPKKISNLWLGNGLPLDKLTPKDIDELKKSKIKELIQLNLI